MADRTINIAGAFKQPVDITNSLQNGEGCTAENYSHAEGFETSATGSHSYACGYRANAKDNHSYVWSGDNDLNGNFVSNGDGTYNIFVKQGVGDALDKVFLNSLSLKERVTTTFGPTFSNASLVASNNVWSGTNVFNGNISLANSANISASIGSQLNFLAGTTANFAGSLTAVTITDATKDRRVATLEYVSNLFQSSLNVISSNYVKRGGSLTSAIGSSVQPIYVNSSGNATPITNKVVTRSGDTAGNAKQFVYMNGGSLVTATGNVGDNGKTLVFLKNGTLTASSISVGTTSEGKTITYLKNGVMTESTATVGSTVVPVYLNKGVLTQFPSNVTIGGKRRPVYIKGGSITQCEIDIPTGSGGTGGGITTVEVIGASVAAGGNFIKTLKSDYNGVGKVTITASLAQPTISDVEGLTDSLTNINASLKTLDGTCSSLGSSCSNLVSSLAKYAPKFGIKVSGDGNVISSVAFENSNSSINLKRDVTAFTSVAEAKNNGNVLASLKSDGSSIVPYKKYAMDTLSGQRTTAQTNQFVNTLSYSNGTLSVGWGTASGSGGNIYVNRNISGTLNYISGLISPMSFLSYDVPIENKDNYIIVSSTVTSITYVDGAAKRTIVVMGTEILNNSKIRVILQNIGQNSHGVISITVNAVGIKFS